MNVSVALMPILSHLHDFRTSESGRPNRYAHNILTSVQCKSDLMTVLWH